VRYFEDRVEGGVIKHARVAKQIGEVKTRGKRPPKEIEDEARDIVVCETIKSDARQSAHSGGFCR
jgi:chorismate mutase